MVKTYRKKELPFSWAWMISAMMIDSTNWSGMISTISKRVVPSAGQKKRSLIMA